MASHSSSSWRFWKSCPPPDKRLALPFSTVKKVETARRIPKDNHYYHLFPPPPLMDMEKLSRKKQKKLFQRDPFVAAMIECGKDKERKDKGYKAFVFSCKNSCLTSDCQVIVKNTRALDPRPKTASKT
ncbi:hypothetical protein SUGI_0906340 [Cryptomeria japonica]|nr:hypothetical protein SUGI_0906340 [Cryptomeria japonica]